MRKKEKALLFILFLILIASLEVQKVQAIPTFILKVTEGDWVEYTVETAQDYAIYSNINKTYIKIKSGDKIKYILKGKVYSAFRGPTGGEFCYLQYPVCDIYINNNKTSENEIITLEKETLPPFLPVETKEDSYYYFWEDIDRYYQYWENMSELLHFPYPNYTFIIEKEVVTIKIIDKHNKMNLTAIYDKDTGVLRSLHKEKIVDEKNVELYIVINDTNIREALLPSPPWYIKYWYISISLVIVAVYLAFSLKNKLKPQNLKPKIA